MLSLLALRNYDSAPILLGETRQRRNRVEIQVIDLDVVLSERKWVSESRNETSTGYTRSGMKIQSEAREA